jgi:hypothetical protein
MIDVVVALVALDAHSPDPSFPGDAYTGAGDDTDAHPVPDPLSDADTPDPADPPSNEFQKSVVGSAPPPPGSGSTHADPFHTLGVAGSIHADPFHTLGVAGSIHADPFHVLLAIRTPPPSKRHPSAGCPVQWSP